MLKNGVFRGFLMVAIGLACFSYALAEETVIDSYEGSRTGYIWIPLDNWTLGADKHAQCFTQGAGEKILTKAQFWGYKEGAGTTGHLVAKLYEVSGTCGTNAIPTGAALATSEQVAISGLPAYAGRTWLPDFIFEDDFELQADTDYFISVETVGDIPLDETGMPVVMGNAEEGEDGNSAGWRCNETNNRWLAKCKYDDMAFYVWGEDAGPPPPEIELIYPENTSDLEDFYSWTATTTNLTLDAGYYVDFHYGTTTAASDYIDHSDSFLGIEATTTTKKGNFLQADTTYYAYAELDSFGYPDLASSTLIWFHIATSSVYGIEKFSIYDTIASSTYEGGTPLILLECESSDYFCNLFALLVNPRTQFGQVMKPIRDLVEAKPPIGYFALISALLLGEIVGTTTKAYQLADLSSLTSFFNPVSDILTIALWFLFAMWLFNRIRHLNL